MKALSVLVLAACLLGWCGAALAESNALASGVEKVTKAPFMMLKGANEHLFSPVKDVDAAALDFSDNARAAVVSVGLNFGHSVE